MRMLILIILNIYFLNSNEFVNGYLNEGEDYGKRFKIEPVKEINTPGLEYAPVLSSDGRKLYFVSDRKGSIRSDYFDYFYRYPEYSKEFINNLINFDPYYKSVKFIQDFGIGFKAFSKSLKDSAYFVTLSEGDPQGFAEFKRLNDFDGDKIRIDHNKFLLKYGDFDQDYYFYKDKSITFDFAEKIMTYVIYETFEASEAQEKYESNKTSRSTWIRDREISHDLWIYDTQTKEIYNANDRYRVLINSNLNEGAVAIAKNGEQMFITYCNADGGYGLCDIYTYNFFKDGFDGSFLPSTINTNGFETQPTITEDGNQLVWVSTRPGPNSNGDDVQKNLDLWYANKQNGFWSDAMNLSFINTPGIEESPYLLDNGNAIIFSSNSYGGYGGQDFFICINKNGKWTNPINLGPKFNSEEDDKFITVSSDGKTIYFNRGKSTRELDIFKATLIE